MKPAVLSTADQDDLVRLDDSHWTTRENLCDERDLLYALRDLEANAQELDFTPEFLEKQKRHFIHDRAQKTEMQELHEQARVVFDELTQSGPLALLTGPPGAAKSTVSGPRRGPRDNGDAGVKKMEGTQALAAAFPFNRNKPAEFGEGAGRGKPGVTAEPPDPAVTGSTRRSTRSRRPRPRRTGPTTIAPPR